MHVIELLNNICQILPKTILYVTVTHSLKPKDNGFNLNILILLLLRDNWYILFNNIIKTNKWSNMFVENE